MKRELTSFFIVLGIVLVFTGCSKKNDISKIDEKHEMKTTYMEATYGIDVNNKEIMVGDADYVILANVIKERDTVYLNAPVIEDENGEEMVMQEYATPYTYYDVEVLQSIKGNLEVNSTMRILKAGGIIGNESFQYEGDNLLEKGKNYILLMYTQPDGSIRVVGANSSIEVENSLNSKSSYDLNDSVVNEYINAHENEIVSMRERFDINESKTQVE